MATLDLSAQLSGHVFQFLLVFSRIGSGIMLFPGIGESFVSARIRLVFAFSISFILVGVMGAHLPAAPATIGDMVLLIAKEVFIGLFFGSVLRLLMDILETAGSVIAVQTGLSNAMILNPTQATQSSLPSALLGMTGIALIFASGLDYFLLQGLVDTYRVFPVGAEILIGDMAQSYAKLAMQCLLVGVEISSPFLVVGLLLYVALGMIQRMMPQIQLFIIVLPLQIWGGILLFASVMAAMAAAWMQATDRLFGSFIGG